MKSEIVTTMFIDGQSVAGQGQTLEVVDPATGQTIASMAEADEGQIAAAAQAAQRAFADWSRTPPRDRGQALLRIADRIEAHAEELAALESRNCGKPRGAVLADEIPAVVDVFRFYAGAARCMTGSATGSRTGSR